MFAAADPTSDPIALAISMAFSPLGVMVAIMFVLLVVLKVLPSPVAPPFPVTPEEWERDIARTVAARQAKARLALGYAAQALAEQAGAPARQPLRAAVLRPVLGLSWLQRSRLVPTRVSGWVLVDDQVAALTGHPAVLVTPGGQVYPADRDGVYRAGECGVAVQPFDADADALDCMTEHLRAWAAVGSEPRVTAKG